MTSRFMREMIADVFALLYADFLGLAFVLAGLLVGSEFIWGFGIGFVFSISTYLGIRGLIVWAYRRYDPDPLEERK